MFLVEMLTAVEPGMYTSGSAMDCADEARRTTWPSTHVISACGKRASPPLHLIFNFPCSSPLPHSQHLLTTAARLIFRRTGFMTSTLTSPLPPAREIPSTFAASIKSWYVTKSLFFVTPINKYCNNRWGAGEKEGAASEERLLRYVPSNISCRPATDNPPRI